MPSRRAVRSPSSSRRECRSTTPFSSGSRTWRRSSSTGWLRERRDMRNRRTKVAVLALLALVSLFACSSDEGGAGGSGTVQIFVVPEDTIANGLQPGTELENVQDGWTIAYQRYLVAVGNFRARRSDNGDTATDPTIYVLD